IGRECASGFPQREASPCLESPSANPLQLSGEVPPMLTLVDATIPRCVDALVRDHAIPDTEIEAWLFEDEPTRRRVEALLADKGVRARLRSAYKPLLHFFLEEVELSGLSRATIRCPSHAVARPGRFRMEAYPLAGLLKGVPVEFENGTEDLHYVIELE